MDMDKFLDPNVVVNVVWPAIMTYAPKIIGFFLALIASKILAGWTKRLVVRGLSKADSSLQKFLSSLAKYTVLTVGVVASLGYLGVETASFAAIIAASGLAIGLAFQGTLSNFASGVMLLIFRPFKVGDYVEAGGVAGIIDGVELFTTEVKSVDNRRIIVPNSAIFGSVITNYSHHPTRRVDVPVGTAYEADIVKTREVLENVAKSLEGVLEDPPPQVFLAGLGASSIDWQLRMWCNSPEYWNLHQRAVLEVKQALDAAQISIPFPQQTVHFGDEALQAIAKSR